MARLSYRESAARFGHAGALRAHLLMALRRVFDIEYSYVFTDPPVYNSAPDVQGYTSSLVDRETFEAHLSPALAGDDFGWAFDRGDTCGVTWCDGVIVGYDFVSFQDTPVLDGLEFRVPPGYCYSYASFTDPEHRGRGLAAARLWHMAKEWEQYAEKDTLSVWYVSVANLSALASSIDENVLLGYAGYVRLLGRWCCFTGSACRRLGTGFVAR